MDVAAIGPVSKDTIRARVYSELKRALLSGMFEPGQVIIARVVAEQMGVGLMPVRESIQQLVTEGGLEFLPSRTIRVPTLTGNDLNEIFEIRMSLECTAAEKAAQRITPDVIAEIRYLADQVIVPEDGSSAASCLAANSAFHFRIYEAANAPHLYGIIERLWLNVGPLLILPYHARGTTKQSFFDTLVVHEQLVDKLAAGDGPGAAQKMAEILGRSLRWYNEHGELRRNPGEDDLIDAD